VRPEGLGKFKNSLHQVSNPRPSGLKHSALAITLPRTPSSIYVTIHNKHYIYTKDMVKKQNGNLNYITLLSLREVKVDVCSSSYSAETQFGRSSVRTQ
jgi:hypothetical protein